MGFTRSGFYRIFYAARVLRNPTRVTKIGFKV